MKKTGLIAAGVLLAVGVLSWSFLGGSESESAIARFQARLVAARDGHAAERLLEGSDLIRREQSAPGDVEVTIVTGDRVSVLGPITERDGRRGFFGPVIVVRGTFDEWHALMGKASVPSIPETELMSR